MVFFHTMKHLYTYITIRPSPILQIACTTDVYAMHGFHDIVIQALVFILKGVWEYFTPTFRVKTSKFESLEIQKSPKWNYISILQS